MTEIEKPMVDNGFANRADQLFFGRDDALRDFRDRLRQASKDFPALNVHGVTGTGKSFLLHRYLKEADELSLPAVKVQFDGKDREESLPLGQHHEILRHIATRLNVNTPRFAMAYLAWSLSKEFRDSKSRSKLAPESLSFMDSGFSSLIDLLITSSMGPGGLLVAAAKAGWKFVAQRVTTEPIQKFASTGEGEAFAQKLKSLGPDDIPSHLNRYLAADLHSGLAAKSDQACRALIVFDSWEQFEEQYPERRSRWHEERQIVELFQLCRDCVQFVVVGQRAVTWLTDDRNLQDEHDIVFLPLRGLARSEARGYLSERRGISSPGWMDAILDATAEGGAADQTTHHSLTLGMAADTAEAILSEDAGADPSRFSVKPNDLEDLVRRFLSVREDMEPVFERLALTPRFDGRAIALSLGKPFDEFTVLADLEAMQKLSFIQTLSQEFLSMHGLMRKTLRERMQKYNPAKVAAGHSAWRRHYSERGEHALAFRHWIAIDAAGALSHWASQLETALAEGDSPKHAALTAMGEEIEDEVPYLPELDRASLFFEWAGALRKCGLGESQGRLAKGLNLIERCNLSLIEGEDPALWIQLLRERARVQTAWADLDGLPDRYRDALDALERAQAASCSLEESSQTAQIMSERARVLLVWGRMTASIETLRQSVEASSAAIGRLSPLRDLKTWCDAHICLGQAQNRLGSLTGDVNCVKAAIDAGSEVLATASKADDPLRWAEANWLVGNAYRDLADTCAGTQHLESAAASLLAAESVYSRDVMPNLWADLQISIAYTLVELGKRSNSIEVLQDVIRRCKDTLELVTSDSDPLTWSLAWGNIASALRAWGDVQNDPSKYAEAAEGYRQAITARPRDTMGFFWAIAHINLGKTLLQWCKVETNRARLDEAERCFTAAQEVLTRESALAYFEMAEGSLLEIQKLRAEQL